MKNESPLPESHPSHPSHSSHSSPDFTPSEVEPWPAPVDGSLLLSELAQLLKRFLVLPQWAPETLALWTLHTYAFHLRDVTTYLGIESPEKRCGKTTLLAVLSELANRAVAASNISPPAFFRVIEDLRPTLLIDEADTFLDGNDQLRGILNSGYSRATAYVVRVSRPTRRAPDNPPASHDSGPRTLDPGLKTFSCWCPKVMAAIGRLPETLADRCIIIRMQRKTPSEKCERLRDLDASSLRRQCARFVMDHAHEIAAARPSSPESLNDRAADIWEPLLALADLAGGPWPELARQAAVHLCASAQESNPIGSLLLDIWVLFLEAKSDRIFSRALIERLNAFAPRPWSERADGKPITDLWLSQQLRPYGIRPRTMRKGELRAKGYLQQDFTQVFKRYIPRSEVEAFRAEVAEDDACNARGETPQPEASAPEPPCPVVP